MQQALKANLLAALANRATTHSQLENAKGSNESFEKTWPVFHLNAILPEPGHFCHREHCSCLSWLTRVRELSRPWLRRCPSASGRPEPSGCQSRLWRTTKIAVASVTSQKRRVVNVDLKESGRTFEFELPSEVTNAVRRTYHRHREIIIVKTSAPVACVPLFRHNTCKGFRRQLASACLRQIWPETMVKPRDSSAFAIAFAFFSTWSWYSRKWGSDAWETQLAAVKSVAFENVKNTCNFASLFTT